LAILSIALVLDYLSPSLAARSATEDGNEYIQTGSSPPRFGITSAGTQGRITWYITDDHTRLDLPCDLSEVPYQEGVASWYGPGFHGKRAADGSRFDMDAPTVAHKSLPLGTQVCIKNPANDRVVVATVTDRGPYVGRRIVDLSRGIAKALEIDGLGDVEIFL
jgi:rare lipoprotein A (peptidoglycan hydrolase)